MLANTGDLSGGGAREGSDEPGPVGPLARPQLRSSSGLGRFAQLWQTS
jgi:hypothetical protein